MEKIWFNQYPAGVPQTVDCQAYNSLVELFDLSCQQFADRTAFYDRGTVMGYASLQQHVCALATFFQQQWKCKKGDRIALVMPNILQYPLAFFAALKAGAVVVNANPLYTVPELVTQLKDADVKNVVVLDIFAHKIEAAAKEWSLDNVMVATLGDLLSPVKACLTAIAVKYIKRLVPAYHLPKADYFKQALFAYSANQLKPVSISSQDLALLQYTGGTTGTPKGAMLSHGNLVANVIQTHAWVKSAMSKEQDVVITALPLYHIFSLTANLLLFTALGGMNVLIINPRNIKDVIRTMQKIPFTVMTGVNTLYQALLNSPDFARINFKNFRWAISGGMALQPEVAERFKNIVGKPIIEGYGLTETSPIVLVGPLTGKRIENSSGLPIPSTDVKIADDAGNELSVGEVGELLVKGPQVMQGYWRQEKETQNVLSDGWLKTGDLAKIDEHGFVFLMGRKKDLIIVSGFKVFPDEVEKIISTMPQIAEIAIVADHDHANQEIVKAVIVKKDPALTEKMVLDFCHQHLTGYKIPRKVEFRNELPKTLIGKVARRKI